MKTYHEYYPVLEQYSEEILNEEATLIIEASENQNIDRTSLFVSKEDFKGLGHSGVINFAQTLESQEKSNVEIGRMYERFIGYLYERDSWKLRILAL